MPPLRINLKTLHEKNDSKMNEIFRRRAVIGETQSIPTMSFLQRTARLAEMWTRNAAVDLGDLVGLSVRVESAVRRMFDKISFSYIKFSSESKILRLVTETSF